MDKTLEELVLKWAEERGLLGARGIAEWRNAACAQLLKTTSELGELADALLKNDRAAIIDGIGDVLVTLIIFAKIVGDYSLDMCLDCAYHEIKNREGRTVDGVFIKK
jgi:NTP pyrophosphatase (non-canonical NTP hydrolase)